MQTKRSQRDVGSSAELWLSFINTKSLFMSIKDKNYVAPSLFNVDEEAPHEVLKEWQGMPECVNKDLTPSKQLLVSFRNSADYRAFAELVGQPLTPKTKSIWFPKVDISRYMDKQYKYTKDESDTSQE